MTVIINFFDSVKGFSQCLESCPSGYYIFEDSCLQCHEYCLECVGPSNKNCTECKEDEVGEDGERKECVPACPTGQEYDTTNERCVLKR